MKPNNINAGQIMAANRLMRAVTVRVLGALLITSVATAQGQQAVAQAQPQTSTSIIQQPDLAAAEANCAQLLAQYTNSPLALAEIHAAMARRYMTGTNRLYDQAVIQCLQALQGPLAGREAIDTWRRLGWSYFAQASNARSLAVTDLRKKALAAFLNARNLATGLPGDVQAIDREIVALYRDVPYTEEIATEGGKLITNTAVLLDLTQQALAASVVVRPPSASNPPPADFHFDLSAFEIQGTIAAQIPGNPPGQTSASFSISVNGTGWYIETQDLAQTGTGQARQIHRVGTADGTNIVSLSSPLDPVQTVPGGVYQGDPNANRLSGANVYSNIVPAGEGDVSRLWLMFASQVYFQNNLSSNQLPPLYDAVCSYQGNPGLQFDAAWQLTAGQAPLPWQIVIYNDGQMRRVQRGQVRSWSAPQPYQGGFTNAIAYVDGVTNFNGINFPAGFVFCEYGPSNGMSRFNLALTRQTVAVVTAFSPSCSRSSMLPDAPGNTVVSDWRVASANGGKPALYGHSLGQAWR